MTLVGIFEYIISVAQRYIVWCCEYSTCEKVNFLICQIIKPFVKHADSFNCGIRIRMNCVAQVLSIMCYQNLVLFEVPLPYCCRKISQRSCVLLKKNDSLSRTNPLWAKAMLQACIPVARKEGTKLLWPVHVVNEKIGRFHVQLSGVRTVVYHHHSMSVIQQIGILKGAKKLGQVVTFMRYDAQSNVGSFKRSPS